MTPRLPLVLALSLCLTSAALAQEEGAPAPQAPPWLKPCTFEVEETIHIQDRELVLRHKLELAQAEQGWSLRFLELNPVSLDGHAIAELMRGGRQAGRDVGQVMGSVPTIYVGLSLGAAGRIQGSSGFEEGAARLAATMTTGMVPPGEQLTPEQQGQLKKLRQMIAAQMTDSPQAPILRTMAVWKTRALWQAWAGLWGSLPAAAGTRQLTLQEPWGDQQVEAQVSVTRGAEADGALEVSGEVVMEGEQARAAHQALLEQILEPTHMPRLVSFHRASRVKATLEAGTLRPRTVKLELTFKGEAEDTGGKEQVDRRSYRFFWGD